MEPATAFRQDVYARPSHAPGYTKEHTPSKKDILLQLQKDILPLQGFRAPNAGMAANMGLGPMAAAFPHGCFPTGGVHELLSGGAEQAAVSGGFVAALLSTLMQGGRVCIWIGASQTLFPPALKGFGVEPDQVVFIHPQKEKDILWAMEEALKCEGLAAVVGEVQDIGFTASRRLQLAVEQSRVTGFIIRHHPRPATTTACVARWKITSMPSELENGVPGVGFPRWHVSLLKIRNGRPGAWPMEWRAGRFQAIIPASTTSLPLVQRQKTG